MNCPRCGRFAETRLDREAIEDWGHCLGCDHADGEAQTAENEEDYSLTN